MGYALHLQTTGDYLSGGAHKTEKGKKNKAFVVPTPSRRQINVHDF